ncbi:TetR/AcrR family transcriptional regulator [Oscillatoriales cyanobacterium LEGE 11467]|uniref:TetR/AcrR family transcriptional regulator n=1 Tax=Zarconia navalis LEGE 11467 TaxID=1828826 RepID=A0A928VSS6_9CYAN|nr:TetR/AcrR family transcriptional regulator [Zarconia navalis]MBE9039724.1 TetR/AcrR family transcriptional regulator [Zarconia navalis LEGE 11467]
MSQTPPTPRSKRSGRPRSEKSKAAIIEAAWKLLETTTLRDLSIEAISRKASVGKTTIYRWWPNKVAIVMDAFFERLSPELQFPEESSAAEALSGQMALLIEAFCGEYGRIVAQIIAEGQACPTTLQLYQERFLDERRQAAKAIVERGIERGEFDPSLDPELALDILYGPIYYRLLVKHLPLDDRFAQELSGWALKAISIASETNRSS